MHYGAYNCVVKQSVSQFIMPVVCSSHWKLDTDSSRKWFKADRVLYTWACLANGCTHLQLMQRRAWVRSSGWKVTNIVAILQIKAAYEHKALE